MSKSQDFIDKINSLEYGVWYSMIKRCHDPNHKAYKDYGGRGIVVCDRWLGFDGFDGFDNFISDMGHRPPGDLSLDRIDNDGPYSLENCRWATRKEQARNRRSNRILIIDGLGKSVAEWADVAGINQRTIRDRLDAGWAAELAVFSSFREKVEVSIGEKYGKWTVISLDCEKYKCVVQCDCDKKSTVRIYDLKIEKTTQCKSCCMKGNKYAGK